MVIFSGVSTSMVLDHDTTRCSLAVMPVLVYRRDVMQIRQICDIHMITAGSLWCEILIDPRDAATLEHHGIWYETQGVRA